ncbi:MAG TPA: hypothetical protein VK932_04180 [Kofleriaceae bacterium]|nr:hypothetical protein [Kofleriaceae bacterium]
MKTQSKVTFAIMMAVAAAAAGGCVMDERGESATEDTETTTAELSSCREIKNYQYRYGGSTYRWDVTTQLWDGKQFVDERRIGGGFYRQYRVSPVWSDCWHPNETVRLTSGTVVNTGIHVCLPDGREEFHGQDYQRLLVPEIPFITYDCSY